MPDVLIRMKRMPENCFVDSCPCLDKANGKCNADTEGRFVYGDRPFWCPLQELPAHGDLVDIDMLRKWSYEVKTNRGKYQRVINVVNVPDIPVVIPTNR